MAYLPDIWKQALLERLLNKVDSENEIGVVVI